MKREGKGKGKERKGKKKQKTGEKRREQKVSTGFASHGDVGSKSHSTSH